MKNSWDTIGFVCVELTFFILVIGYIVAYIRAPRHTMKGLVGVFLIGAITGLYVIINLFFRSDPFFNRSALNIPPIVIVGPIYFITIKQGTSRNTTIFMLIVLAVMLISYCFLLVGQ